ncbi:MAG: hypothetical protein MAG715_01381 [Methanonatronarchaeales archaeon]|nr:hypothetical protein [Methanonatronarchaeales archaeon]
MDLLLLAKVYVTLFTILDPVGNVPVFLTLSKEFSDERRRRAALLSVAVAFLLILAFAFFGQAILLYLNVSLESLMIAGAILLLIVSLELMRGTVDPEASGQNIAFAPMGTPLLAGPGAIVASMVFMQRNPSLAGRLTVVAGITLAVFTMWPLLRAADSIDRLLGRDVINALSRVMGILLAAIAVEFAHDALVTWI